MMPSADAMMISDQTIGKRMRAASLEMLTPRPVVGPPKYSATIAPIMLRVVATLSALKMKGSAVGSRTLRKISNSLAAYERINSSAEASAEVRPRTVLIMVGKKVRMTTIATFDSGLSTPNQAFVIGAKAMIGTEFTAIA